jgi:hypothetical protein
VAELPVGAAAKIEITEGNLARKIQAEKEEGEEEKDKEEADSEERRPEGNRGSR